MLIEKGLIFLHNFNKNMTVINYITIMFLVSRKKCFIYHTCLLQHMGTSFKKTGSMLLPEKRGSDTGTGFMTAACGPGVMGTAFLPWDCRAATQLAWVAGANLPIV